MTKSRVGTGGATAASGGARPLNAARVDVLSESAERVARSAAQDPALRITRDWPADRAIAALLRHSGGKVHALALRLLGHRADADDLVQEVFLTAFRKWSTFRGDADPSTWLYSIALRAGKRKRKGLASRAKRERSMSALLPWSEMTVTRAAAAPGAIEDSARHEAAARMQREIVKLPEHLRVAIILKEILGLSVEATASTLGLSPNTVKTRLMRARLALRKSLIARAAAVAAPAPIFDKQVCIDLLKAKMDAMDRGGAAHGFKVPQADVCARCRAVFREFDLVQDACGQLSEAEMPAALRKRIIAILDRERPMESKTRRGRRPVSRARVARA